MIPPSNDHAKNPAERTSLPDFKKKDKEPKPKETLQCNACGRTGHNHTKCNFVAGKHPDINPDFKIKFSDSVKEKAWAKQCEEGKHPKHTVSGFHKLDGTEFVFPNEFKRS